MNRPAPKTKEEKFGEKIMKARDFIDRSTEEIGEDLYKNNPTGYFIVLGLLVLVALGMFAYALFG